LALGLLLFALLNCNRSQKARITFTIDSGGTKI
jgi:hypothetical protein